MTIREPLWQMIFAAAWVAGYREDCRLFGVDRALENARRNTEEACAIADTALEAIQANESEET